MAEYDLYDVEDIRKLVDGELPWPVVQQMMKNGKDRSFDKWLIILQGRVPEGADPAAADAGPVHREAR